MERKDRRMKKRELYTGNKPFAYIAFTPVDAHYADSLLDSLDNEGYRYWLNDRINPSEKDMTDISKRLLSSYATVLILTENAVNDRLIKAVMDNTVERRSPIVVYKVEESEGITEYLRGLFERFSQVVVLRAWEQGFSSSNSVRQVLATTKGLTEEKAERFYLAGIEAIRSGAESNEDIVKAMKNITYAANGEYPPALHFLGDIALEKARAGVESYSTAVVYYKMAAEQGYLDSIYRLGCLIADGEGFEAAPSVAAKYIAIAAVKGIADAQYRFAEMLDEGKGIPINREDASNWYKKALENGDRRAYLKLAYRYMNGDTVTRDENLALEYFEEAAKDDAADAYFMLANMYRDGIGAKKNAEKSMDCFLKAAKAGITEAQYNYALCLQREKKYVEAFKWLNVAATEIPEGERINPDVLYEIAECYAKGNGTDLDRRKAFLYYYDAATRGHHKGKMAVADCYRRGIGVPVNKKAAGFYNPKYTEE